MTDAVIIPFPKTPQEKHVVLSLTYSQQTESQMLDIENWFACGTAENTYATVFMIAGSFSRLYARHCSIKVYDQAGIIILHAETFQSLYKFMRFQPEAPAKCVRISLAESAVEKLEKIRIDLDEASHDQLFQQITHMLWSLLQMANKAFVVTAVDFDGSEFPLFEFG